MDSTETLSGRVAEQIRRELGGGNVTKSELARRLGVSHTWVINRLTGHQDISLNEVEQIAAALGVEVASLLPAPDQARTIDRYAPETARPTPITRTADATAAPPPACRPNVRPVRPGTAAGTGRTGRPSWIRHPVAT